MAPGPLSFTPPPPSYLGDSVYVRYNIHIPGGGIVIYLDNGYGPKNEIVMEPETLGALEVWLEMLRQRIAKAKEEVRGE